MIFVNQAGGTEEDTNQHDKDLTIEEMLADLPIFLKPQAI